MKVFKKFNNTGDAKCPICGTNEEAETVLIGIDGTEDDGNMEAVQIHLKCIKLRISYSNSKESAHDIIYQVIDSKFNPLKDKKDGGREKV